MFVCLYLMIEAIVCVQKHPDELHTGNVHFLLYIMSRIIDLSFTVI